MTVHSMPVRSQVRLADAGDRGAIARFLAQAPDATAFHRLEWLEAVERASGHRTHVLMVEHDGGSAALLPPCRAFATVGRALVSTGFAVGGGVVGDAVHVDAAGTWRK
jgi:hypothetical protein